MERGVGSIWCLVLLIPGLLSGCWSQGSHTVVIDGYRHNSNLTSGDSVPLGTQIIIVCRVVGLPYGTPLSYTWTCPNGPCEVEGHHGRKVYNEHILAVNTTSTSDGGTYTCQVTATGGQEATGSFTLNVTGGRVVHSYGRLIPHEFPITNLQQISGPGAIGRITCTGSSGTADFTRYGLSVGVTETMNGTTAMLEISTNAEGFQNGHLYCNNPVANYFYLFILSTSPSIARLLLITREFQNGIELNWLPPTEPNGDVHYVIYYTPEGGTEQPIDTGSNLNHYNLTGLERNRVYTNIAVQAVNSAGRSGRSAVIAQYNHMPLNTPGTDLPTLAVSSPGLSTAAGPTVVPQANQQYSGSTAIIAGAVVTLLVVVLLLTLAGGVITVVLVLVKRKKAKENCQSHSKAYLEDNLHEGRGPKDADINMYQNVQSQSTPASGHNKPYYSTPADNFVNPASATAYFNANLYDSADYSKEDHRGLDADAEELYEEARADESSWGSGGYKKPVKSASEAQTASTFLAKKGYELMHPEDFYAQPDKTAKVKKDNEGSKIEETPAPVEDIYTMPDMTKKMKQRNQKSLEQESEERKLPPQAPLPYKKHKEAKEEGEEDVPELPPAYDFDGEQDCATGDGDGSERRFEYAVLDWQKK